MRYELTDFEWVATRSFLPNKPRGVPRVDDRRVLNAIFWVLRSGAPWLDLPASSGPCHSIRLTLCESRQMRTGTLYGRRRSEAQKCPRARSGAKSF